jgi:hypothetical protein
LKVFDGAIMELKPHLEILQDMPKSREMALAITKLEECIMWLEKASSLVLDEEVRNRYRGGIQP